MSVRVNPLLYLVPVPVNIFTDCFNSSEHTCTTISVNQRIDAEFCFL